MVWYVHLISSASGRPLEGIPVSGWYVHLMSPGPRFGRVCIAIFIQCNHCTMFIRKNKIRIIILQPVDGATDGATRRVICPASLILNETTKWYVGSNIFLVKSNEYSVKYGCLSANERE